MASIRRSNRVLKPRDYWDPTITTPRQRRQPAFTIYTEPSNLSTQLHEGLGEGLGSEVSDQDLGSDLSNQDLDSDLSDQDLGSDLSNQDLGSDLSNKDLDKALSMQLHESLSNYLSTQSCENQQSCKDQPYQPQFLSKDRAGKSQNLPEDPNPLKLFQLFFPVKEIENIVKQTNH